MKYLVIIERGPNNLSAYVPDLPGCTSAGMTLDEVLARIQEAIEGHIEIMRESGEIVPEPSSESVFVDVATT